jgi:hypothetical protein
VGPEVTTRDSILLTYFVDKTPLQILRNRGRRLGNFILNEFRSIGLHHRPNQESSTDGDRTAA